MTKSFGMIALCIFLFITGIMLVTNVEILWMGPIRGLAALVASILLFLGK